MESPSEHGVMRRLGMDKPAQDVWGRGLMSTCRVKNGTCHLSPKASGGITEQVPYAEQKLGACSRADGAPY